jgi:kumamolisin
MPGIAHGQSASNALNDDISAPVEQGVVVAQGEHAANAALSLNVVLAVREPVQLEALIQAASTPGSPAYGRYLTQAQYDARYAPSSAEVDVVKSWLTGQGLEVIGTSPDNSIVHALAPTSVIEHTFATKIDNYALGGREFYANVSGPSLPSDLRVNWVGGLSNYEVAKAADTCAESRCGYNGNDFRSAYDLTGSGEGQTIGFTLWGRELPESDYTEYAKATSTTPITIGVSGNNGLDFIQVGGPSSQEEDGEIALDTENAHTVAPGVHETYWLGHNSSATTLETVLDEAASSSVAVISNSWDLNNHCKVNVGMETALEHGAATGKTFYFATGDSGAREGCTYPSVSQYAVAVGGTELEVGEESVWKSEEAFDDGGGCSNKEPRPSWQTGIGSPLEWPSTPCTGRATPDVSADSCYSSEGSGANCWSYVYVDGASTEYGGTSLATPIWAAASVVWNRENAAAGRPGIGFAAPLIYSLANDPTTYARDFHDIQSGSNGFEATPGWDEATGWGSPIFDNLFNNSAAITYTGPAAAKTGSPVTLSGDLDDQGTTHGVSGRTLRLSAGAESCEATTNATGEASCSVQVVDAPGVYSVSAAFAGDAAYTAVSSTGPFTVEPAPTPPSTSSEAAPGDDSTGGSAGDSTSGTSVTPISATSGIASTPQAIEALLLDCTRSLLVLSDAYIHGPHVMLSGSAAKSLVGKKISILFDESKRVATTTVSADGQFAATAPLPPAKVAASVYTAEIGKARSPRLALANRVQLQPPQAAGTNVTLTGQIELPLAKPIATVIVEEQLECGKTTIAKTFVPPANGRLHIALTVPAAARAAIFRLKSSVATKGHAMSHSSTAYSLPLPVSLG